MVVMEVMDRCIAVILWVATREEEILMVVMAALGRCMVMAATDRCTAMEEEAPCMVTEVMGPCTAVIAAMAILQTCMVVMVVTALCTTAALQWDAIRLHRLLGTAVV
jgi:hypothetical protein